MAQHEFYESFDTLVAGVQQHVETHAHPAEEVTDVICEVFGNHLTNGEVDAPAEQLVAEAVALLDRTPEPAEEQPDTAGDASGEATREYWDENFGDVDVDGFESD